MKVMELGNRSRVKEDYSWEKQILSGALRNKNFLVTYTYFQIETFTLSLLKSRGPSARLLVAPGLNFEVFYAESLWAG